MDILPFGGFGGPKRTKIHGHGRAFLLCSLASYMRLAIWMSLGMMVTRFA